jgi:hypothetical protein
MNSSMTTIQVSVETAEVLKMIQAEADARQLPLDVYLRTLTERANGEPEKEAGLSPQEKARLWREWVERNAVNSPYHVDDSRESIYAEREDKQLPLSAAEKVAFFRQWIAGLDRNTPLLSDEAISRESIYSHEGER